MDMSVENLSGSKTLIAKKSQLTTPAIITHFHKDITIKVSTNGYGDDYGYEKKP